jgi:hypothetical protein
LGVTEADCESLALWGISSICNLLAAIKTAKYFELGEDDVILTVFTDSVDLYGTRLTELTDEMGSYQLNDAVRDHAGPIAAQGIDYFKELSYHDRKAIHNLKYFTWVEQQGKTVEELNELWESEYWSSLYQQEVAYFNQLIEEFNEEVGG